MKFRYPLNQQQLREAITGRFDCTAYAAADAGDADSRGRLVFSGRQVRLATDEPRPDPVSPGLNLRQVDEALYRLSHGAINLDTQWGAPWSRVASFLIAGKWAEVAIIRGVLVDEGYVRGFRDGHATLYGYDQDRRKFVLLDPLVPEPIDVPSDAMARAATALMRKAGVPATEGQLAYVAFTRDVWEPGAPAPRPVKYTARFRGGSFFAYRVNSTTLKIVDRVAKKFSQETSAPAEAPRLFNWPGKGNRRLARVTRGVLAGHFVEPAAWNVDVEVAA